jgi:BolA protein
MVTAESLKEAIQSRLPTQHIYVEDLSGGCGQAIAVIIVSSEFQGKNKLARSRLINGLLKEEIAQIHAFQQKNFTPEEWEVQKVNYNV